MSSFIILPLLSRIICLQTTLIIIFPREENRWVVIGCRYGFPWRQLGPLTTFNWALLIAYCYNAAILIMSW